MKIDECETFDLNCCGLQNFLKSNHKTINDFSNFLDSCSIWLFLFAPTIQFSYKKKIICKFSIVDAFHFE